jgi:hypothetical protein
MMAMETSKDCFLIIIQRHKAHLFIHYYYANCSFTTLARSPIGIGLRAKHFTVTLGFSFKNWLCSLNYNHPIMYIYKQIKPIFNML